MGLDELPLEEGTSLRENLVLPLMTCENFNTSFFLLSPLVGACLLVEEDVGFLSKESSKSFIVENHAVFLLAPPNVTTPTLHQLTLLLLESRAAGSLLVSRNIVRRQKFLVYHTGSQRERDKLYYISSREAGRCCCRKRRCFC